MNTSETETVDENKNIKRSDVNDQHDVELFKKFLASKAVRDNGFVFAEGGYRIVLVKPDEKEVDGIWDWK